ncbi:MAG: hypothetical protein IJW05_12105 [Lentisphaeria bacterium]|nr:hypothetical protein [Lentisphaeria bacterium]
MSKVCPRCKNLNSSIPKIEYHGEKILSCVICGQTSRESRFLEATVFHQITQSPEVLAKFLVFHNRIHKGRTKYHSAIVGGEFDSYQDAIAATVAKLKDVCDE